MSGKKYILPVKVGSQVVTIEYSESQAVGNDAIGKISGVADLSSLQIETC